MRRRPFLVLLLLILVAQLAAAKVEMHSTPQKVEITGGTGVAAWKLVYGTSPEVSKQLLEVSPERAYFAHGGWVRLIDTTRGVVVGRWHVGPKVTALKRTGSERVDVEVAETARVWRLPPDRRPVFKNTVSVGPGVRVTLMPTEDFSLQSVPAAEPRRGLPEFSFTLLPKLKPERLRQLLPEEEEMARRDPLSPWMKVFLGYLWQRSGDPRAATAWAEAVQTPRADFTELLPISAYLFDLGQEDLARAAYERGYRDLLERGYDPRLMRWLFYWPPLFLPRSMPPKPLFELPQDLVDRVYRLAPYPEFGWVTWQQYANDLERQGRASDAQLWQARAREARERAPALIAPLGLRFDRVLLVALAVLPAFVVFVFIVNRRYAPQHRADMESGRKQWAIPGISNLRYWTISQRLGLLVLVLLGWFAMGLAGLYAAGLSRAEFGPISSSNGSFAGPVTRWYFQTLPASPERNLLLAMAYQQSRDPRRAETAYRKLPQFAESWNNLGVILKDRGDDQEARAAFQRALQLDPQLHEAAFNLNGSTPDFWTELHQRYVPGRPMLAIPRSPLFVAAYLGGSTASTCLWGALRGPFWRSEDYWVAVYLAPMSQYAEPVIRLGAELLGTAALLFALLMVFVVRREKVTEAPGPRHWIAELIFPGTAPAWSVLGGMVLVTWSACWTALAFFLLKHSPWFLTSQQLWYMRWYTRASDTGVALLNPSWLWFVLPAVALFAVNAAIVLWARKASAAAATGCGEHQPNRAGENGARSN